MSDWRDTVAKDVAEIAAGSGISSYRESDVLMVLDDLARIDRRRRDKDRVGYAYVLEKYTGSGLTRFLGKVRRAFMSPPDQVVLPEDKVCCVISLNLTKDTFGSAALVKTLTEYLATAKLKCEVLQVERVFATWYDVLIAYELNLSELFHALQAIPWVIDSVTKPSSDFGKRTIATER